MSFTTITEISINILQLIVLFFVILNAVVMIGNKKNKLVMVLFALSMTSFLLSILYWIAYDLIRPDTHMPLAVNEMGETAMFLLLGACMATCIPRKGTARERLLPEQVGASFFALANIVIWIFWTGEWFQDIIGGTGFAYLMFVVAGRLRLTDAWKKRDFIFHGLAGFLFVLLYTLDIITKNEYEDFINTIVFIILSVIILYSMIGALVSIKKNDVNGKSVCLAFSTYVWAVTGVYSTSGIYYTIINLLEIAAIPMLLIALKKEVSRYDQR